MHIKVAISSLPSPVCQNKKIDTSDSEAVIARIASGVVGVVVFSVVLSAALLGI